MKKIAVAFSIVLTGILGAQTISSSRWTDLFSYNNVLAIRDTGSGKLIAATENGIFYYSPNTGEITKLSKANGLHEVKISAFDYNPETKTGLVGYANGSMDVISPSGITYIVDIPIATGYSGTKKIHHISITGNQAAVSVGYGVSVFNLDKKEFGDTAFFNNNGIYEPAIESVIQDKTVYSITTSGLKKHEINVTFPLYGEWQTVAAGITNIDTDGGTLAYSDASRVWVNGTVAGSFSDIKDITVNGKYIAVAQSGTNSSTVSVLDGTAVISSKNYDGKALNTAFYNGNIFAGSHYDGILDNNGKPYKPDGPYNNKSYKIALQNGKIWVSTGARDSYNGAIIDPQNLGFYHYTGKEWVYPEYFKLNQFSTNPTSFNVLDVIPNPSDDGDVFFTNYTLRKGQGIYNMVWENDDYKLRNKFLYDTNPSYERPVGCSYDDKNNLFCTFAAMDAQKNIGIGIYNKSDFSIIKGSTEEARVQKPIYYNGLFWIPVPGTADGATGHIFLVYNDNGTPANLSDDLFYRLDEKNGLGGNIRTIAAAPDLDGDIWIGTSKGLFIYPNGSESIKDKNIKVSSIIITQNGITEELFKDSSILQIDVDSGNQKWVSVDGGGAFYLSPNGQNTLLHFTKENSPIPTNTITDIKFDPKTGNVYFVTYDGIVVYHGDVATVDSNFGDVLVYPNPVITKDYSGNVHLKGLAEKTNIRIVDVAGNLVHQAVARGGVYEWDLTSRGKRVASGIYFVLMTNADGTDKATAKIAVVN